MKYKITHQTTYSFDAAVFIEPHYLRFRPKQTAYVAVNEFSIHISSSPKGHKRIQDEDNNEIDFCWFEGLRKNLQITTESILETSAYNPFDFILEPQAFNRLPFQYTKLQQNLLHATLEAEAIGQELLAYGDTLLRTVNFNTISYLTQLTTKLHQDFSVEYREDGAPLPPDETFALKRGSCRDLAWMQIHLLRQQGIAARFVSGYYYFDMEEPQFELHAWVQVFLPGTGWLGLDPSHGMFTANTHFPIASSAHYEQTMPVSGGIRGSATAKLKTSLSIEKIIEK